MAKIISRVRKAVSLPVLVKIRIGFNQDSASHLEISQMVHGSQKLSRWRSGLGKAVREVDIPDSVTEVKTYAFDGCDLLATISFPERVSLIGESAFRGCVSLRFVYFNGDAPRIRYGAFEGAEATLYFREDRNGWKPEVAGRPTKIWERGD